MKSVSNQHGREFIGCVYRKSPTSLETVSIGQRVTLCHASRVWVVAGVRAGGLVLLRSDIPALEVHISHLDLVFEPARPQGALF